MLPTTIEVPFYGDAILTIEQDGQPYVAIKPICDRLGLAWQPQHRKLTAPDNDWGVTNLVIPSAGGFQETTCLALFDFPLWLTTISPNRVSDELRDVLKRYRREAKQVLFDHFVTRQRRTELQLAATHTHLLAQYPRWAKLATLIKGGATEYLVFKRSNMTREQFDAELKEMERCGLLDPTRFRPWGKDTVQQERDQARVDLMLARDRIAELEGSRHG